MSFREVVKDTVKSFKDKTKHSPWWIKWFWYILAGSLGLLLIAFLVFETLSKSRKAAKALHERDVLLEKTTESVVNASISKSEKQKQKHLSKAIKYEEKAILREEKATAAKKRAIESKAIINSLQGWDDAEKNIKY